jgi:gamma-glutamyltranspeptidase/glutathione hydrolase
MHKRLAFLLLATTLLWGQGGLVVSQDRLASVAGAAILARGGNAVDAAVATAFALAVTHPAAGNLGGGGFLLSRDKDGKPAFLDFRETAPAASTADMFTKDGVYDEELHHRSWRSVGVPGTVAGLHSAWRTQGHLPWRALLEPAIRLARDGFPISPTLAASLAGVREDFLKHPGSRTQFTRDGAPLAAGDLLRQEDLARTLERIAARGPRGFYRGETARLIVAEMKAHGGLITLRDLAAYRCVVRRPLRGTYRGLDLLVGPPPCSGGTVLLEMLNILEGYDLAGPGVGSAATVHLAAEAMRRAFLDRARFLGDPGPGGFGSMPVPRLIAKDYAAGLRKGIDPLRATPSAPEAVEEPLEGEHTTHLSVVDGQGAAVSLTYTLEDSYGSKIVVPGAGFLLNNEMGDFNAAPGLTDRLGHIGTRPNLAAGGKRMLSSMCPTILLKDGKVWMVTGSPGGRTIPNTVLWTILWAVDGGLKGPAVVAAPRFHLQWLPDVLFFEKGRLAGDVRSALEAMGHPLQERPYQGCAQVIMAGEDGGFAGAADGRWADSFTALAEAAK